MIAGQFWINVFAITISPLLAVQATMWIQKLQEKRMDRLGLFRVLMSTRELRLSFDHVRALNMVCVVFYGKKGKYKEVIESWKAYMDHLYSPEVGTDAWNHDKERLFYEMLGNMSKSLGYKFDMTDVKRTSYSPQGYADQESLDKMMKSGIVSVINGNKSIPVTIVGVETDRQDSQIKTL
jgi:hypothetical protein